MTTSRRTSESSEAMVEWLESEVRDLRQQLSRQSEQAQADHTQICDLAASFQRAEAGAGNVVNQIDSLAGLAGEMRGLRERTDRLQGLLAQDQERVEHFGRQIRAEMQTDRDDRTQAIRSAEFAARAASGLSDRIESTDEIIRHIQDEVIALGQRFDGTEITSAALDSRISATTEAQRRIQSEREASASQSQEIEHAASQLNERFAILEEQIRRVTDGPLSVDDIHREMEAMRERIEAIRITSEATAERSSSVVRDHGSLSSQIEEAERSVERQRTKAEQQERTMVELRILVQELRDVSDREAARFISFQEKLRRRQIADLEQEVREIRGYTGSDGAPGPNA
jgi:chromosome segregation ATPase